MYLTRPTQMFRLFAFFAFSQKSVMMHAAAVEEAIQSAMETMSCNGQATVATDAVRKRPDGLYNIVVFRENTNVLNSFVEGQTYIVSVAAVRPSPLARRITDFKLVVVRQYSLDENGVVTSGTFRNIDGQQTTINVACPHIVSAGVGFRARSEVLVTWTAPRLDGDCVEFRASIVANESVWYEDLIKVLCEQRFDRSGGIRNHSRQQPTECCACGTAKYLLTFRGLWPQRSRLSESPSRLSSVHWSSAIGASHSENYAMWSYGMAASRGVGDVCEYGDTNLIEDEMHQQSTDIRTVIKTPGMRRSGEPRGANDLQQRWAHFSTDRRNHLLSLLAQVGPSTDWCIGVTGLDLCLPNCSWASELVVELTPWDAGVSEGDRFIADRRKTSPVEPIHRLNNTFSQDPASPFFGTGVVLPMGLLRLQRLQPKADNDVHQECTSTPSTSNDLEGITEPESSSQLVDGDDACPEPTPWSDWTPCSATCGQGTMTRSRSASSSYAEQCSQASLYETMRCDGACVDNEDRSVEKDCALTIWSSWSPCQVRGSPCFVSSSSSFTYEPCTRRRQRTFVGGSAAELSCVSTTEEEERCLLSQLPQPTSVPSSVGQSKPSPRCRHRVDIGPCDRRMTRWFHDGISGRCRSFQYSGCGGNGNRFDSEMECMRMCVRDRDVHVTSSTSATLSEIGADDEAPKVTEANSAATMPVSSTTIGDVVPQITASDQYATPASSSSSWAASDPYDIGGEGREEGGKMTRPMTTSVPSPVRINCIISAWSTWSPCSATCGDGAHRLRRRAVETAPRNGGRNCTRRLEELQSCGELRPCIGGRETSSRCRHGPWSSWSTCAKSCGTDSVQERVRRVTSTGGDESCTVKVTRRVCTLPSCVPSTLTSGYV